MYNQIFAFMNIGTSEMMLILAIVLLLFGGKKLPELARGLGRGIRDFKDASEGIKREISDQINNFEKDIDLKIEENPLAEAEAAEKKVKEEAEIEAKKQEEGKVEKKVTPQFSTPEGTIQYSRQPEYGEEPNHFQYGYTDHFAADETATKPTSVEEQQELVKPIIEEQQELIKKTDSEGKNA